MGGPLGRWGRRGGRQLGQAPGRRTGMGLGARLLAGDELARRRPSRWTADEDAGPAGHAPGTGRPEDGDEDGDGTASLAGTGDGPRRPSPLVGTVLPPRPLRDDNPEGDRGERRPTVPGWMRDPVPAARWWLRERAQDFGFHLCHSPEYVGRALAWTPRGLTRGFVGAWRWVTDAQTGALLWQAAELGDTDGYLALADKSTRRSRARAVTALTVALLVVAAVVVAWPTLLGRLAVLAAVVAVGGWLGRPADRPLFDHPVLPPSRVKITPDLLVEAFCAARLCNKHDDPDRHRTVAFLEPTHRDGNGYRAVVDLPGGHTAAKALTKRMEIAAGLGIDEVRVFLERVRGDDGSARRVLIWVADRDPYAAKPQVSPLAHAQRWDFWEPIPFGTDARGRPVAIPMVFTNLLVGAIPRMGKTYAARIIAAAAALDPTVRGIYFDAKGPDWQPFAQVAHRYGFGLHDAVVEHLVEVLEECRADAHQRFKRLMELPIDARPESKVTPAITRSKRLDMPLTVVFVDEVQHFLGHPLHGDRILELLTELCKVHPAVGYMLVLATQRPDSDVIPSGLRDNIGTRFAMMVKTWQSSDTILGAGAYKSGLDASKFQRSHKGVGILDGADDSPLADAGAQTARTDLLDLAAIEVLCARGRALRVELGTLTGAAAGEQQVDDRPRRSVLDDVAATFATGEDRLWSETICARLVEDWPDTYTGWGPSELAAALTPYNIDTAQMWGKDQEGKGHNRRGVVRQHVLDAIAARPNPTPGGSSRPATPLAAPGSLAPDTARSSTPASGIDQASSDLATPTSDPAHPQTRDSAPGPLAANPPDDPSTDDHQS